MICLLPQNLPVKVFINIFRNKHVQFVLLIIAGCWLIYLSIRTIDIEDLWKRMETGNYRVAFPVMMVSLTGYFFRSMRWKLILKNMHEPVALPDLYAALSIGYAVNFATPRLGEISRCLILRQSAGVPIDKSLISVFIERMIDIICLAAIVAIASWISFGSLTTFLQSEIIEPLLNSIRNKPILLIMTSALFILALGYLVYRKLNTHTRVKMMVQKGLTAFKDVLQMKEKKSFLLYTFIIWGCYFLMTYLWFGVFEETASLGLREAFVIMAVGSVGRSVPIQGGGMGAYHYLVSNVFAIFGVSLLTGNAMAFVIHGAQMVLTLLLGIAAWIWVLVKTEK
ncbi:MAG: lysylphosphatidylglycerol synthase transmembrane domain-containing protein [Bacteroidota bacterium]